jgi:hypothetical protein
VKVRDRTGAESDRPGRSELTAAEDPSSKPDGIEHVREHVGFFELEEHWHGTPPIGNRPERPAITSGRADMFQGRPVIDVIETRSYK